MDLESFLISLAHLFTAYAPYSPAWRAFTVSAPFAELLFNNHVKSVPGLAALSLSMVLREGRRQGLWEIWVDPECQIDIVVIRWICM